MHFNLWHVASFISDLLGFCSGVALLIPTLRQERWKKLVAMFGRTIRKKAPAASSKNNLGNDIDEVQGGLEFRIAYDGAQQFVYAGALLLLISFGMRAVVTLFGPSSA